MYPEANVVFEPLDFMDRLAALVPTPRADLTRYHGVFAADYRLREPATPARRGRRDTEGTDVPAPARDLAMTWAQRSKRVFKIDDLRALWRRGDGDHEHRRSGGDHPDP